ncbi:MAG: heme lyase CcmF/NrfE family subunit [Betaproteobacteria bacterium]|nr:heme lyase CcmF/NrfE family subunit [Betaproteobacteria bacterium]
MIPELGHFALILALLLALVQAVFPMYGAARGDATLMSLARPAAYGSLVLIASAFLAQAYAFASNDFSVLNVASHSNSKLPLEYRLAATWGSHEGSLLLWTLMLSGWMAAVARFSRHLPLAMVARVLSVMGMVAIGFLLFMLVTSNPFERLLPAAPEGRDLNPLLQDPGMVFHPPMLYMGYVGFSVAFAFALAALLGGRLDATWARWSRPWTTLAWCFLTAGIALGSVWAYYELGWGGWWFWDPVENASFMPWLAGTALIHSLAVTEKRGAFRSWTVLLAIIAFSLSLLGTFLVRSGVLTSVHAFATDPARGVFILAFLAVVIGGSLALYASRAGAVGLGGSFAPVSREALLLGNNVLLVVALAAVLLGTLYPLFIDALGLGKLSVGPPYFEAVFYPLMAPVIFLMGLGPMARWKQSSALELWRQTRLSLGVAVFGAMVVPWLMGRWSPLVASGLLLAFWVIATSLSGLFDRLARGAPSGFLGRLKQQPLSWWGMQLGHMGVAVFIIGVALVKAYEVEKDLRMAPGDTTSIGAYQFRLVDLREGRGPNFKSVIGRMEVWEGERLQAVLRPEKRNYDSSGMPMTEAAIQRSLSRDLYVSLGDPIGEHAWGVRIYVKPFVNWIWGGCVIMALGGLLAIFDRRYRLRAKAANAAATTTIAPEARV